jgi:transcriptional regulator with XRE-family HTH domain
VQLLVALLSKTIEYKGDSATYQQPRQETKMRPYEEIRVARARRGWSQTKLGEQVGCSGQYIGKLERGEADNPSRELLMRIGEVLEIPFERLLFGDDAKPGLSEQDILIAKQIRDLPGHYKAEIYATIIKAKADLEEEKIRNERQAELAILTHQVATND